MLLKLNYWNIFT